MKFQKGDRVLIPKGTVVPGVEYVAEEDVYGVIDVSTGDAADVTLNTPIGSSVGWVFRIDQIIPAPLTESEISEITENLQSIITRFSEPTR